MPHVLLIVFLKLTQDLSPVLVSHGGCNNCHKLHLNKTGYHMTLCAEVSLVPLEVPGQNLSLVFLSLQASTFDLLSQQPHPSDLCSIVTSLTPSYTEPTWIIQENISI